ncbi:hypothetical protein ACS0TY_030775 [Phlomoides rotata]
MDETSTISCHDTAGGKSTRGRQSWTKIEEDALIHCLKEIVKTGWKMDNGFKCGFQRELEKEMRKMLVGTDLSANPHINSKIHVWKKEYGVLFDLLSKSGIGWNDSTNTLDIENESVWEQQKKADPKVSSLRYKSWPYYCDWQEIFGRDRATGEGAAFVKDYIAEMQKKTNRAKGGIDDITLDSAFVEPVDTPTYEGDNTESVCKPGASSAKKKSRKRKSSDNTMHQIMDQLGEFLQSTESTLGGLAQRIGYEQDAKLSRTELFQIMNGIEGLTLKDKLKVSDELVRNTERLELFLSLPDDAKSE